MGNKLFSPLVVFPFACSDSVTWRNNAHIFRAKVKTEWAVNQEWKQCFWIKSSINEQPVFCSYFLFDWLYGRICVWQWVHFVNPSHYDQPAPLHLSAQGLTVQLVVCVTALPNSNGIINYQIYTKVIKEFIRFFLHVCTLSSGMF